MTTDHVGRVAFVALLLLVTAAFGTDDLDVVAVSAGSEAGGVAPPDPAAVTGPGADSDTASGALEDLVVPGGVPFSRLGQARLDELALRAPLRDTGSDNVFRPLPGPDALPLQPPTRVLDVFATTAPADTDQHMGKATVFLASFTNEVMGSSERFDVVDVPAYVLVVDDMPGFGRKIGGVSGNHRQPTDCRSFTMVDARTATLLTTETVCG